MKRKFNILLVLVAIIPLAILIGIGLPLITYFTGNTFEMEDDFSRDLRIEVPKYKIVDDDWECIYDSGGMPICDITTYTIVLEEPLSEESLNILKREKRGWREHGGGYHLRYSKGYDTIECCIRPNLKNIKVKYETDGQFWIIICIMFFAIPAVGWLIFFLCLSIIIQE